MRIAGRLSSHWLLIGLLACIAAFQFLTIEPGHGWGDDFAMYIAHARNLVERRPYSDTGYIYNPEEPIGPRRAPPGLPILLAPIYAMRGADLVAMKILMVVAFIVALAFFASLVARWESPGAALLTTALVGFNPYFRDFKNNVLSDLPFLSFFMLSIWLGERAQASPARRTGMIRTGIALGLAWEAAYATRTVGMVLPAAFVISELLRTRRLSRTALLALAVFLFSAALQAAWLTSPSDYLTLFSFQPERIADNAARYAVAFRNLLDSGYSMRIATIAFFVVGLLAIAGFVRSWQRGQRLAPISVLFYLGMMLIWPINEGTRYVIPLIPFFFLYAVSGARLFDVQLGRLRRVAALSVAGLALIVYGGRYYSSGQLHPPGGIGSPNAQSLFAFIRTSTPPSAVIVFKKPRALALYTGRRAAIYTTSGNRDPWRFIREIGATHAILIRRSRQDSSYLAQLELTRPHSVSDVFENDEFTVYRLIQ